MLRTLPTEIQISQLTKENEELIREINRLSLEEQLIKSSKTSNSSLQSRSNHEGGFDLRFQNTNKVEDNCYKRSVSLEASNVLKGSFQKQQITDDSLLQRNQHMGDIPSANNRFQNASLHLNRLIQHGEQNSKNNNISKQPAPSIYKREVPAAKCKRMSERLIGEIAFQLDKRILHNVFSHRKRLYGFTVRNITEKIEECSRDIKTRTIDVEKRESLRSKHQTTMSFLARAASYNPQFHPVFTEKLINKYGVLRVNKGRYGDEHKELMKENYLKSLIIEVVQPEDIYHAMILLNSLLAFMKLDGKPLFMW